MADTGAGMEDHDRPDASGPPDDDAEGVVLVVEDEPDLAALYAEWLCDRFDVRAATGGKEALETIDETVDVALLDRRMSGLSGGDVLAAIRDEGYDCRAAMVTAVDPDFDIIGMEFDDYLSKPVSRDQLVGTVEALFGLAEYSDLQLELSSKKVRHSVLSGEKRRVDLEDSEEFARLEEEIERLEERLDDIKEDHPDHAPLFERVR